MRLIEKGENYIDYESGTFSCNVKIPDESPDYEDEELITRLADFGVFDDGVSGRELQVEIPYRVLTSNLNLPISYDKCKFFSDVWARGTAFDKMYLDADNNRVVLRCPQEDKTVFLELDISAVYSETMFAIDFPENPFISFLGVLGDVHDAVSPRLFIDFDELILECTKEIDPNKVTLAYLPQVFKKSINPAGETRTYSHLAGTLVTCHGETAEGKIVISSPLKANVKFEIEKELLLPVASFFKEPMATLDHSYMYHKQIGADSQLGIHRPSCFCFGVIDREHSPRTYAATFAAIVDQLYTFPVYSPQEWARTLLYKSKSVRVPTYQETDAIDTLDAFNIHSLIGSLGLDEQDVVQMRTTIQGVFNAIGYNKPLTVKNIQNGIEATVAEAEAFVAESKRLAQERSKQLLEEVDFDKIASASLGQERHSLLERIRNTEANILETEESITEQVHKIKLLRKNISYCMDALAEIDGLIPRQVDTKIKENFSKIFGSFEVLQYNKDNYHLVILVPSVTLAHPISKVTYNTGSMLIDINLMNSSIHEFLKVHPAEDYALVDGKFHPHVSSANRVCWGEGYPIVQDALYKRDYYTILRVLMGILSTYNPDSPYIRLDILKAYKDRQTEKRISITYRRIKEEITNEINNR